MHLHIKPNLGKLLLWVITYDWQWYIQKQKMFDDEEDNSDRSQQYLANQRTFLSWVRTSIALIALGFAIERFSIFLQQFRLIANPGAAGTSATGHGYSTLVGIGMIIVGTGLIVYALKNYLESNKTIASGRYMPKNAIVYTASVTIIGLGIIIIIFLIAQLL
jgi:putative membrane protein